MTSGAEPRSPIGRRKRGREPPLILEFAYIDFTHTRLEAGPSHPALDNWTEEEWACSVFDPNFPSERPLFALVARCARHQTPNGPETAQHSVFTGGAVVGCEGERRRWWRVFGGGLMVIVPFGNGGGAMMWEHKWWRWRGCCVMAVETWLVQN